MYYMKMAFILCLLSPLLYLSSQAAILTVDNSSNSSSSFSNVDAAISAATAGDTIHIIGSNTSYGNVLVTKQLTIIGAGYNPPNQLGLRSEVNFIALGQNISGNDVSGTKITGLYINVLTTNNSSITTNITIERCFINSSLNLSAVNSAGWVIQNNILLHLNLGGSPNCAVRNNIITGTITSSDEPSVTITNNLFTGSTTVSSAFQNVQHAQIMNNIFYSGRNPQGCTMSVFNNNITFQTANNTLPYGNNTGSGNIVNSDPLFANVQGGSFQFDYDYRLGLASPGSNAGTDNSDIGIYGGTNPFPIGGPAPFLTSAPPRVPQVMEINIMNTNLPQGTPLNFQVIARKQN